MNFNWAALIPSLPTLIAAIAPSIISIFTIVYQAKINKDNNEHQLNLSKQANDYKLKQTQLEDYCSLKSSALDKYLDSLNSYIHSPTDENLIKYKSCMYKTCLYVSKSVYDGIESINDAIKIKNFKLAEDELSLLLSDLNHEVQQYHEYN